MIEQANSLFDGRCCAMTPTLRESPLRVVIVHPNRIVREALAMVFAVHRSPIRVIGCLADAARLMALPAARLIAPDVVLLGGRDRDEQEASQVLALRTLFGNAKLVLLSDLAVSETSHSVPETEACDTTMVRADCSLRDLVRSIAAMPRPSRRPSDGAPTIACSNACLQPSESEQRPLLTGLTVREAEILRFRQQGLSHKAIALTLRLEVQTVKNHARNLALKLRMQTRARP